MIFKSLKKAILKTAIDSVDLSKPLPVAKVGRGTEIIKPKRKTVITDVIERPENYILEAWIDKSEINIRVKRRFEYVFEPDTIKDVEDN